MNKKLALFASLLLGGAVVAWSVGRNDPNPDAEPAISSDAAAPAPAPAAQPAPDTFAEAAGDAGPDPQPDALARLDAERLRLAEALAAAEAEAARLAAALAEAEARAQVEPAPAFPDPAAAQTAARLDALTATLAERDAELARIGETLAARDAELARLSAAVAGQTAEIARLTAAMADRDAELAAVLDAAKIVADAPGPTEAAAPAPALEAAIDTAKGAPVPRPAAADAAERPLAEVHFDMGSATLSPGGAMRAREAAAALAEMGPAIIRITGHSDTIGGAKANLALSRARAQAVADALVAAGLPPERIEVIALGQDAAMLPVPTAAGVAEPLNRSAGIWALPATS